MNDKERAPDVDALLREPFRFELDVLAPVKGTFHLRGNLGAYLGTYKTIHDLGITKSLELAEFAI